MAEENLAVARAWNLPISPKYSREIAYAIRGMNAKKALKLLDEVIAKKRPIELKRHKKEVPHHYGKPARWPVKPATYIKKVLINAINNAKQLGMDEENLYIARIEVHRGIHKRPWFSRVLRRTRKRGRKTHVFIWLGEVSRQ